MTPAVAALRVATATSTLAASTWWGASNGGYMSLRMATNYPGFFASEVPICPGATPNLLTDAELRRIETPTWFVQAAQRRR